MLIILSLYDTLFVYRLIICFRLNLNLMTLHIESTHVYTQNGVAKLITLYMVLTFINFPIRVSHLPVFLKDDIN
jgi:hypothetical protein